MPFGARLKSPATTLGPVCEPVLVSADCVDDLLAVAGALRLDRPDSEKADPAVESAGNRVPPGL